MSKFKNYLIGFLLIAVLSLSYFLFQKPDEKIVKIPVTIEVPIPGKIKTFPPIELPVPKKEKPRPILEIPDENKDSVLQDILTERDYKLSYKDSIQEINVKSKVLGKLLKQEVDYNIYPDTVFVDTIIHYKLPKPKIKILVGGGIGINTDITNLEPVFDVGVMLQNKKNNIIKLGIDTNGRPNIGYYFKL